MLEWPGQLLNVSSTFDQELYNHPPAGPTSQTQPTFGLTLTSAASFTVTLSRTTLQSLTNQKVIQQVLQEYGIEEEQLQIRDESAKINANAQEGLKTAFALCRVEINGNLANFINAHMITELKGMRVIVDDGNTLLAHFWDNGHHYVLLHEIKY